MITIGADNDEVRETEFRDRRNDAVIAPTTIITTRITATTMIIFCTSEMPCLADGVVLGWY